MASFPSVFATMNTGFAITVAMDLNAHWQEQRQGSPGKLAQAISETDTTVTIEPGSVPGDQIPKVGSAILIDNEVMLVTAVQDNMYTVTRNTAPMAQAAAIPAMPHQAGTPLLLLTYSTPWEMIGVEALLPYAKRVVDARGPNSATFGVKISGSLSLAPQS
jgi:hypothetical protein